MNMKRPTLIFIILTALFFTSTLVLIYLNYLRPQPSIPTLGIIPTQIISPTPNLNISPNQYNNIKYKYGLTFPSSWSNKYNIVEISNGTNFTYKDTPDTKTVLFSIYVLSEDDWVKAQSEPHGILIENDTANNRVFVYSHALDTTFTGQKADDFSKMVGDIKQIISTFKLTSTTSSKLPTNWEERTTIPVIRGSIAEYLTQDGCFGVSVVKDRLNSLTLKNYILSKYGLETLPEFTPQYQYKDFETITIPAMNAEEISHTYISVQNNVFHVQLYVMKPIGPPQCDLKNENFSALISSLSLQ